MATIQLRRKLTGAIGAPPASAAGEPIFSAPGFTGGGPNSLYINNGTTQVPLVDSNRQVELAGVQTITGPKTFAAGATLTLGADPLAALEAATKQYVDTKAATSTTLTDGLTITGTGLAGAPIALLPSVFGTGLTWAPNSVTVNVATAAEIAAGALNTSMVTPLGLRGELGAAGTTLVTTAKTVVPALNEIYSRIEQLVGVVIFAGTYDATTNIGVFNGQGGIATGTGPLPAASAANHGAYVIVTVAGTGAAPAPVEPIAVGDWLQSDGTGWLRLAFAQPMGAYLPLSGGVLTGPLTVNGDAVFTEYFTVQAASSIGLARAVLISGGATTHATAVGGGVTLNGGAAVGGAGGFVRLTGGNSDGVAGLIQLIGGVSSTANGGNVTLQGGRGVFSGSVIISGGESNTTGDGGAIQLTGGMGTPGATNGGPVTLTGGTTNGTGVGGALELKGGGSQALGGNVDITGGNGGSASGGHVRLSPGPSASGGAGDIMLLNLATTTRTNLEAIWNNNGVLNIGAGAAAVAMDFVPLAGGQMTGPLNMAAGSTGVNLLAGTDLYVMGAANGVNFVPPTQPNTAFGGWATQNIGFGIDDTVTPPRLRWKANGIDLGVIASGVVGDYVAKTGDTMTGHLIIDPSAAPPNWGLAYRLGLTIGTTTTDRTGIKFLSSGATAPAFTLYTENDQLYLCTGTANAWGGYLMSFMADGIALQAPMTANRPIILAGSGNDATVQGLDGLTNQSGRPITIRGGDGDGAQAGGSVTIRRGANGTTVGLQAQLSITASALLTGGQGNATTPGQGATLSGGAMQYPGQPAGNAVVEGGEASNDLTAIPGDAIVRGGGHRMAGGPPGNTVIMGGTNNDNSRFGAVKLRNLPIVTQADVETIWNNNGVLNIGAGGTSGIADAPVDTFTYGRQDAQWMRVLALTGGTLTGNVKIGPTTMPNWSLYTLGLTVGDVAMARSGIKFLNNDATAPAWTISHEFDSLAFQYGTETAWGGFGMTLYTTELLCNVPITMQGGALLPNATNFTIAPSARIVGETGAAASSDKGGDVAVVGGSGINAGSGGDVTITGGPRGATGLKNGDVALSGAMILLPGLATVAQTALDALWNNNGVLNIGAGGLAGLTAVTYVAGVFTGDGTAGAPLDIAMVDGGTF